jgi:hypothetical protein
MTDGDVEEVRRRLDDDLSVAAFECGERSVQEEATRFFRDIFVDVLNFDPLPSSEVDDSLRREISLKEWSSPPSANAARVFASAGDFHVLYVELEAVTRHTERRFVRDLSESDETGEWAKEGSFIAVFHAPGEDIWNLVTPYESGSDDVTTGRPVLRRFTLGKGQTHRTVATALAGLDATGGRLAERVDEVFRVEPLVEAFYEDYRHAFEEISAELSEKGLGVPAAERYAHTTLNRLMCFYYLQKQSWFGERTDFVRWFHERYEADEDTGEFHESWLTALFFEGVNRPTAGGSDPGVAADLPDDVRAAVASLLKVDGSLFEPTEEDELDVFLADETLQWVIEGFLERYNFTITEETPYDVDVAVDPSMLGKVYESLIAEQERGEAGIFYTPRDEVDLLCRTAIYEQLHEHATARGETGRRRLVEFVFSDPQDWDASDDDGWNTCDDDGWNTDDDDGWNAGDDDGWDGSDGAPVDGDRLAAALRDLSIVDPACGSGAFLVGTMQVLCELYRKLGVEVDYARKKRILEDTLYGVDVKLWAVQVAELRLWLSLVDDEADRPEMERVWPRVAFDLATGDSLVQTVDGERLELAALDQTIGNDVREALGDLADSMNQDFATVSDRESAVRERRLAVVDVCIEHHSAHAGSGTETETSQPTRSLRRLRERVADGDDDVFLWSLAFPEVTLDGGFDIVVGNPPYVRGRKIVPQSYSQERLDAMPERDVADLAAAYKTQLREYVVEHFDVKPYKTSDLYLYFFFKGFDVLAPGGTLAYLTSNSWLNTKYGKRLQEGLLECTDLEYVFDNRATRSFADAEVNTVITVATRRSNLEFGGDASFVSVQKRYSDFATADTMQALLAKNGADYEIEYRDETFGVATGPAYREVVVPDESLWRLGGGTVEYGGAGHDGPDNDDADHESVVPRGSYGGDRWVLYHRAPDVYFRMLAESGDAFGPLEEHVEAVQTGAYSGLNDFYYFETERGSEFEARIDDEFLVPIIRRPDQVVTPSLDPGSLATTVFVCQKTKAELDLEGHDAALEYVEWGEEQVRDDGTPWPEVSSVTDRDPGWWALPAKDSRPTNLFVAYVVDTRFRAAFTDEPVTSDRCYHRIYGDIDRLRRLHVLFCSTLGPFLTELTGTANLGQGALKFETRLLKELPTPDPDTIEFDAVADAMASLGNRPIGSIFEELGAETPEEITLTDVKDDRRAIDEYVLGDVLALSDSDQLEIYCHIVEMVENRIGKSRSV